MGGSLYFHHGLKGLKLGKYVNTTLMGMLVTFTIKGLGLCFESIILILTGIIA